MITWESNKEQIFEMPTGGAAIMRKGPNLLKLARKEQCLALTTQLRNKFKFTPCFYRVFPDGKVEYLHPKDGVYPEKVNAGRVGVNQNFRRIGENVNPIKVGEIYQVCRSSCCRNMPEQQASCTSSCIGQCWRGGKPRQPGAGALYGSSWGAHCPDMVAARYVKCMHDPLCTVRQQRQALTCFTPVCAVSSSCIQQ